MGKGSVLDTQWKRKRQRVFDRDGNKCLRCGSRKNLTVDHIVPLSKGGTDRYSNLQTLCKKHNGEKGDTIILPFVKQKKVKAKKANTKMVGEKNIDKLFKPMWYAGG